MNDQPWKFGYSRQELKSRATGGFAQFLRKTMSREVADANHKHKQGRRFPLTFRHFNAVAGMVVLSGMGLVSVGDWVFVVFSLAYLCFLSKVAFPTLPSPSNSRVFGERNRLLGLYVKFSAVISFVFPVPYILEGFLRGDKEGVRAAASHVFLLASQILMEGVAFHGGYSLPVFVFVPVLYNSRRIFTIAEWLRCEISAVGDGEARRIYVGRALAGANMAFWCFNLFGFLLPVFLPRAMKVYHSASEKTIK